MKSEGSAGPVVVARGSVDLPTGPAARPAHWPAKPERHVWTSPIRLAEPDTARAAAVTAAAERSARKAAADDERKRLARLRKPKPAPPQPRAPRPAPADAETFLDALAAANSAPLAELEAPSKPGKNRVAPDRLAELVRLYTVDQLDGRQIGGRLAMPYATVYSNLRRAGVEMRPQNRALPPARPSRINLDEAIRLYADGWTMTRLAEKYGVTHTAVSQRFRAAGVPTRNHATAGAQVQAQAAEERRRDLEPQVRDLFEQGMKYHSIATRLGVSRTWVQRTVAALGLTRRQRLDGAEVVRLYTVEQLGCETIAKRLGTVPQAVRYQLHKHGVTMRPLTDSVRRTDTEVVVEALSRLRAGEPVMTVAAALGIGATTVARFRDAAGIPAVMGRPRKDRPAPHGDGEDDGEPSPAGPRRALLDVLLAERFGPAQAPLTRQSTADPLPHIARRRRDLLQAAGHAEEAS